MKNIHMIFGAPGCGKTTRLMRVLEEELKQHDPNRIAFVSFTRKGAYEGAERARALFDYKEEDLPYFRTLHSIAFRNGGYSKYDIISKKDYRAFSVALGMKFTGYYTEEFYSNDDRYLFVPLLRRNNPKTAERYMQDIDAGKLLNVEENYARYKAFAKVADFTDIIETFVERDTPLPVDVAIIDEAQDLTTLQWRMCEVAFRNCEQVYIAGDDDQAIYEWSGADVDYFLGIRPSTSEVLRQSYRLQSRVLSLAKSISSQISHRVDKDFEAIGDAGEVLFYNDLDELRIDPKQTWYFLSRNNWFLSQYRNFLRRGARVYTDKDKLSYNPREIAAINAFEKMRKRGTVIDTEEVKLRLYLQGRLDLSKPWFDNLHFDTDSATYYRDLIKYRTDLQDRSITVNTIHGVKGGEADNVVLLLDFTRAVRSNFESNPDSELRCLYVACTRAKKNLHIIHSSSRNGYDNYMRVTE